MKPSRALSASGQLLAAASAGLLAQTAAAAIYNDQAFDLSNDPNNPDSLSYPSITGVNGHMMASEGETVDALDLGNLLAGSSLDVSASWSPDNFPNANFVVSFRDSSGNP